MAISRKSWLVFCSLIVLYLIEMSQRWCRRQTLGRQREWNRITLLEREECLGTNMGSWRYKRYDRQKCQDLESVLSDGKCKISSLMYLLSFKDFVMDSADFNKLCCAHSISLLPKAYYFSPRYFICKRHGC